MLMHQGRGLIYLILNGNMNIFIIWMAGILGLIIGSFLNVIILRMNTGKGIGGRSLCFSCRKSLSWYELIPVISFLIQRGKCRTCRSRISWQYPIIEFVTGILFVGIFLRFNVFIQPIDVVFWTLFVSGAMVIAVYDLRHKYIPVSPLVLIAIISVGYGILGSSTIFSHVVGAIIVPAPFFIMWLISKGRWIGFGDVEIMTCIGIMLGVVSGFSAIILSFWTASLVVIPVFIFLKKYKHSKKMNHEIPFGPFLLLGTYLVGVCGLDLFHLILNMVH